jgi:hypothetical protein
MGGNQLILKLNHIKINNTLLQNKLMKLPEHLPKKIGVPIFIILVIVLFLLISHTIDLPNNLNLIALPIITFMLLIFMVLIAEEE